MLRLASCLLFFVAVVAIGLCTFVVGLSYEQMYSDSTHIWSGVVTEVDYKDHDQAGFINWKNRHYRLTVNVTGVAKNQGLLEKKSYHHRHQETERTLRHVAENLPPHEGDGAQEHPDHVFDDFHDDETVNVGELVHVHFWQAISRPPGYNLPTSPGTKGLVDKDHLLVVNKELAFFGEYLQRDQVRRYMYHSTHPGPIRRRKHVNSKSASLSKSKNDIEGDNENQQQQQEHQLQEQQPQEEFTFVKGYMAYVPDGVTDDIGGVFEAVKGFADQKNPSSSKKIDL